MTFVRSKAQPPLIKIALDLDDTLASPISKETLKKEHIIHLQKNGLVVTAIEPHILHPGCIEFTRYLHKRLSPNDKFSSNICYFSHAEAKRNNLLVPEILKLAFCDREYKQALTEEEYKLIEKNIIEQNTLSREDCTPSRGGTYFKDLKKVLKPGDRLDSTILIDDQRSNLSEGQISNGLIIPYADEDVFHSAFSERFYGSRDLQAANHLFYVTGLLEKLFLLNSNPITQSLFELQYKEDGIKRFWFYHTDIALMTYNNQESCNISALQKISDAHDNNPVLIKFEDTQEVSIFGKPNGIDWALTSLNPHLITIVPFPKISSGSISLKSRFLYDSDKNIIAKEIEDKKGHTALKYEPKYEIFKDKSLYISGLKTLQQFATRPLQFYGHDANKYFGLRIYKTDYGLKNTSGYFSFWPTTSRPKDERLNEQIRANSIFYLR